MGITDHCGLVLLTAMHGPDEYVQRLPRCFHTVQLSLAARQNDTMGSPNRGLASCLQCQ